MKDLCILFLHHKDDAVTRLHANLIKSLNPEAVFVPLCFDQGIENAIKGQLPTSLKYSEWGNTDFLVYHAATLGFAKARRFLLIEYDTYCTLPFSEFYEEVWDLPAACAQIMTPETNPEWHWFNVKYDQSEIPLGLMGMVPLCGILLSHDVFHAACQLGTQKAYARLFCECRIGTALRQLGVVPKQIRSDIDRYISWQPRRPTGPGIWHAVKSIDSENVSDSCCDDF